MLATNKKTPVVLKLQFQKSDSVLGSRCADDMEQCDIFHENYGSETSVKMIDSVGLVVC